MIFKYGCQRPSQNVAWDVASIMMDGEMNKCCSVGYGEPTAKKDGILRQRMKLVKLIVLIAAALLLARHLPSCDIHDSLSR